MITKPSVNYLLLMLTVSTSIPKLALQVNVLFSIDGITMQFLKTLISQSIHSVEYTQCALTATWRQIMHCRRSKTLRTAWLPFSQHQCTTVADKPIISQATSSSQDQNGT